MGGVQSRRETAQDDSFYWPSPAHKLSSGGVNLDYRFSGPLGPGDELPSPWSDTSADKAKASKMAVSRRKGAAKAYEVGSLVGRAGTAGLGKAMEVLDTLGSSITNLKLGSGFTSGVEFKGSKIEILSFEVANTIMKGYYLRQSLLEPSLRELKEEILCSEGVQRLVSVDMTELSRIVAEDKKKELMVFAKEVVRFGNQCRDPQWHLLDRHFEKLGKEVVLPRQKKQEVDEDMHNLVAMARQTAELYHEMNSLDRFEAEIRRKLQDEDMYVSYTKGDGFATLKSELRDRRNIVRTLKKRSLWSKSLEEVMEKLVDAVYSLHLELENAFGNAVETFQENDRARERDSERLGSLGLSLHYASIINHIDSLISSPGCIRSDSRDNLYHSLPAKVKVALRRKVASFTVKDELSVSHIKAEMEKILIWLVPVASNTTKIHQGFGWVGEWANTGRPSDVEVSGPTQIALIQTLHHAKRTVTEEYILELVVLLHHLVHSCKDVVAEFKCTPLRCFMENTRMHTAYKASKLPPFDYCDVGKQGKRSGSPNELNLGDVDSLDVNSRSVSSSQTFEELLFLT